MWNLPWWFIISWIVTCLQFLDTCSKNRHPSIPSLMGPYLPLLSTIQIKHKEHFMYVKIPSITDFWNCTVCFLARTTATTKTTPANCKINPQIHLDCGPVLTFNPTIHPFHSLGMLDNESLNTFSAFHLVLFFTFLKEWTKRSVH